MQTKRVKIKTENGIIDGVWHLFNGAEYLTDLMGNRVEGTIV